MELLDIAVVEHALEGTDWARRGDEIVKEFRFPDFAEALAFVNDVGRVADEAGHHPDVELSWGRVRLALSTHSLRGLTELDLDLSRRIDGLLRSGSTEH